MERIARLCPLQYQPSWPLVSSFLKHVNIWQPNLYLGMLEKLQLEHLLKPVPNEGYLELASQEGYPVCPCGYHIGTEESGAAMPGPASAACGQPVLHTSDIRQIAPRLDY